MSNSTSLRFAVRASMAALTLGAVSLGCSGSSGGSNVYQVLRLAYGAPSYSSSCNENADTTDSSTTFDSAATAYLYQGSATQYFLDMGGNGGVLVGASSNNGYTFSGKTVAVSWSNPTQGTGDKRTTTTTVQVTLTISGTLVSGSSVSSETSECTGTCNGFQKLSCTTTTSFSGEELQGVQLDEQVPATSTTTTP